MQGGGGNTTLRPSALFFRAVVAANIPTSNLVKSPPFEPAQTDMAITEYVKAVELQPGYVTAWNNLGDAQEKKMAWRCVEVQRFHQGGHDLMLQVPLEDERAWTWNKYKEDWVRCWNPRTDDWVCGGSHH